MSRSIFATDDLMKLIASSTSLCKRLVVFTALQAPDLGTQRTQPLEYLLPRCVELAGEPHDIDER